MPRVGRRSVSASVVSLLTMALTIGLTTSSCGDDPPTKELQQAQQAIDEARASGAARYSSEEFTAAEDAIKRAQAAVTGRDYRQALNDALDARDRAQNASKDTVDKKAKAKVDADRALHDAALAIVDARAKLRTAETGRRASRVTLPLRRDIADAETHVQEARTALAHGDYLDALDSLNTSMQRLNDSVKALDAASTPPAKRRVP